MTGLDWGVISGAQLLAEYENGNSLRELLPQVSAVYFWRLKLAPDVSPADTNGMIRHIERIARLPQGRFGTISLSRSLQLDGITVGGSGLPAEKVGTLRALASTRTGARFLWHFLEDLETRIPALYVGETGNLPARVSDHLGGRSDFGAAICSDQVLNWRDMTFEFLRTGEAQEDTSERRQALEYLATVLTISNYTRRAG